ncbi:MAG: DUF362 domain-containing protein [bacterium]|nr:DUF362 domain-containing protein [bacterium]
MPIYNEDGSIAIRDDLYLGTSIRSANGLRGMFAALELTGRPVIVKPNWFCDLPGQYTDAKTFEMVLDALDGEVIVVEGHSMLRNDGSKRITGANARDEWDWVCEQETEYLRRLGLSEVMEKYGTEYVNVTDEVWNGRIVDPETVKSKLSETYGPLANDELYGVMPQKLADLAGTPLISLARLKIPGSDTRVPSLSLKNMFGLLPDPDRSGYHTNLVDTVIDINLLYAIYFPIIGAVEGIHYAVSPGENAEHEAPWGNYDIIERPGYAAIGAKASEADILTLLATNEALIEGAFYREVAERYESWDVMLPLEARRFVPEISP